MGRLWSASGLAAALTVASFAEADDPARHAGLLHSLHPAAGVLVIEEVGANGKTELLAIRLQNAEVVRVWRDPVDPWRWSERPTRIHRWPSGTFVVVIGRTDPSGGIEAIRVELPRVSPH